MELFKEFRFEAAHFLPKVPEGHKCGRMHGHSYTVVLRVGGTVGAETGWVVDYADLEQAWSRHVHAALDHRTLNEIDGLANPTTEALVVWIWERLRAAIAALGARLVEIEVRETASHGCVYRGSPS